MADTTATTIRSWFLDSEDPDDPDNGLRFAVTWPLRYEPIREGIGPEDVHTGCHVYLRDGVHQLATAWTECHPFTHSVVKAIARLEDAMQPWARVLAPLAAADRWRARIASVEWLAANPGQFWQYDEHEGRDVVCDAPDQWREELAIHARAVLPDRAADLGEDGLAALVLERLRAKHKFAMTLAGANLPPLRDLATMPPFVEWVTQVSRVSVTPCVQVVLPMVVDVWRAQDVHGQAATRDGLIRWALDSGTSKAELSRLTGIAITTFNRVLAGDAS